MEPDEFQINENEPEYTTLNNKEISALLQASSVSSFTPSEKVKQAPINFQKKTLAELAQLSNEGVSLDELSDHSDKVGISELEPKSDEESVKEPLENSAEVKAIEVDDNHNKNEVNSKSDDTGTSEHEELCEKLKQKVSDLEAHISKLESELSELSNTKNVAEADAMVLKQLLAQLPSLGLEEEERFSQKVLSTIEDVIRTRIGNEISEHPEAFVSRVKHKIKDLYVEGSRILIMLNAKDLEAIQRISQERELEQHIKLQASDNLGRGDIVIKAGAIEINDSLQVGLVEAQPEKCRD